MYYHPLKTSIVLWYKITYNILRNGVKKDIFQVTTCTIFFNNVSYRWSFIMVWYELIQPISFRFRGALYWRWGDHNITPLHVKKHRMIRVIESNKFAKNEYDRGMTCKCFSRYWPFVKGIEKKTVMRDVSTISLRSYISKFFINPRALSSYEIQYCGLILN